MRTRLKGSNQFRTKSRGTWKIWTLGYILAVLLIMAFAQYYKNEGMAIAYAEAPIISPLGSPIVEPEVIQETGTARDEAIAIIKKVWRHDWKLGVALASCESGLRVTAINDSNTNGSTDTGLFQVNSIHGISREDLLNGYANAGYAYALYKEQGTNPWYSSEKCWKERI